jgi:uroporphyrinogen decarboxylase
MTPRERMQAAFDYTGPDRIPVVYHPSPAGLHVHGQKLLDLFNRYPPDNLVRFDSIPTPPPGTVNAAGAYHEIRTDEWGTEWEQLIFGIYGHPRNYPFANWRAAANYRFPPFPDHAKAEIARQREKFMAISGGVSLLERICALRPMDELLIDLQARDADLLAFLDRLVAYWAKAIEIMLAAGVDMIYFGDDWGTQTSTIIAPALFREIFKPRYEQLMAPIRQAGRIVFFHSCGYLGEIFDELLALGIRGLWPQIALFEADPARIRKCREQKVAIYIHLDRQRLVPRGTPAEIEATIQKYADRYHGLNGGGIFYIEIENDAPFENVKALVEAVDRYR